MCQYRMVFAPEMLVRILVADRVPMVGTGVRDGREVIAPEGGNDGQPATAGRLTLGPSPRVSGGRVASLHVSFVVLFQLPGPARRRGAVVRTPVAGHAAPCPSDRVNR